MSDIENSAGNAYRNYFGRGYGSSDGSPGNARKVDSAASPDRKTGPQFTDRIQNDGFNCSDEVVSIDQLALENENGTSNWGQGSSPYVQSRCDSDGRERLVCSGKASVRRSGIGHAESCNMDGAAESDFSSEL